MKEWWNNLALREKQMLTLGAFVIGILAVYVLLWSPIDNKVSTLRSQMVRNQELLSWMQDTDKQIQTYEKSSQQKPVRNTGSLLSIIQKQINRTAFVTALSQLHQVENDSVQLTFQKVDFDKLISWLIPLTQQQGIVITQMVATPSGTPGLVNIDLILKS